MFDLNLFIGFLYMFIVWFFLIKFFFPNDKYYMIINLILVFWGFLYTLCFFILIFLDPRRDFWIYTFAVIFIGVTFMTRYILYLLFEKNKF